MYIVKIEKTCNACPSQWELICRDKNGNTYTIYARYRWGVLTAHIALGVHDAITVIQTGWVYHESKHGSELDGTMTTVDMLNHLNLK